MTSPTDRTLAAYQHGVEAYLSRTPSGVSAMLAPLLDEVAALVPAGHLHVLCLRGGA